MHVECGRYEHFKGHEYTVYGICKTIFGEEFILYQQDYDSQDFWIRPLENFCDKVSVDGKEEIERFKLLYKLDWNSRINKLIELLENGDIEIKHSITNEKYSIILINKDTHEIIIASY